MWVIWGQLTQNIKTNQHKWQRWIISIKGLHVKVIFLYYGFQPSRQFNLQPLDGTKVLSQIIFFKPTWN